MQLFCAFDASPHSQIYIVFSSVSDVPPPLPPLEKIVIFINKHLWFIHKLADHYFFQFSVRFFIMKNLFCDNQKCSVFILYRYYEWWNTKINILPIFVQYCRSPKRGQQKTEIFEMYMSLKHNDVFLKVQ